LLPVAVLSVGEQVVGTVGVRCQQEHQRRDAAVGGRVELQLGVGVLRLVTHRRPVPESGDHPVHVRVGDRVAAHLSWLLVVGSEVSHVRHSVPGAYHRLLRCSNGGAVRRRSPEFGGAAEEHSGRPTGLAHLAPSRSAATVQADMLKHSAELVVVGPLAITGLSDLRLWHRGDG
jgi:hypothetical protein